MGMPFPTGLRALASVPAPEFPVAAGSAGHQNAVEWAWAMNAASSVLGSVLAMVIAIQFGLNVTLACGALPICLALLLLANFANPRRPDVKTRPASAMIHCEAPVMLSVSRDGDLSAMIVARENACLARSS